MFGKEVMAGNGNDGIGRASFVFIGAQKGKGATLPTSTQTSKQYQPKKGKICTKRALKRFAFVWKKRAFERRIDICTLLMVLGD